MYSIAEMFHSGQYPIFGIQSYHDTSLLIHFTKCTRYFHSSFEVTSNFLPMIWCIILNETMTGLSPTIGSFGYTHDNFRSLEHCLLRWWIGPPFECVFPRCTIRVSWRCRVIVVICIFLGALYTGWWSLDGRRNICKVAADYSVGVIIWIHRRAWLAVTILLFYHFFLLRFHTYLTLGGTIFAVWYVFTFLRVRSFSFPFYFILGLLRFGSFMLGIAFTFCLIKGLVNFLLLFLRYCFTIDTGGKWGFFLLTLLLRLYGLFRLIASSILDNVVRVIVVLPFTTFLFQLDRYFEFFVLRVDNSFRFICLCFFMTWGWGGVDVVILRVTIGV